MIFFTVAIILFCVPFAYWVLLNASDKISNAIVHRWRVFFVILGICWLGFLIVIIAAFLIVDPELVENSANSLQLIKKVYI